MKTKLLLTGMPVRLLTRPRGLPPPPMTQTRTEKISKPKSWSPPSKSGASPFSTPSLSSSSECCLERPDSKACWRMYYLSQDKVSMMFMLFLIVFFETFLFLIPTGVCVILMLISPSITKYLKTERKEKNHSCR